MTKHPISDKAIGIVLRIEGALSFARGAYFNRDITEFDTCANLAYAYMCNLRLVRHKEQQIIYINFGVVTYKLNSEYSLLS